MLPRSAHPAATRLDGSLTCSAPTVATAVVAQGTVQTYAGYQTSVNARVLASAVAEQSQGAAPQRASQPEWAGMMGLAVAGVGAVVGAGLVL
jgi:hypothetical protein